MRNCYIGWVNIPLKQLPEQHIHLCFNFKMCHYWLPYFISLASHGKTVVKYLCLLYVKDLHYKGKQGIYLDWTNISTIQSARTALSGLSIMCKYKSQRIHGTPGSFVNYLINSFFAMLKILLYLLLNLQK